MSHAGQITRRARHRHYEECDPEVTKLEETDLREDEEILKDENLKVVHKTTKYM